MRCKLYRDWFFRGKTIKAGRTVTVTTEQAQWLHENGYLTPPKAVAVSFYTAEEE
jgi:hypothetical protein